MARLDWYVICCWSLSVSLVRQRSPPGMADMVWGRWTRKLGRERQRERRRGIRMRMGASHQLSWIGTMPQDSPYSCDILSIKYLPGFHNISTFNVLMFADMAGGLGCLQKR